MALAKLIAPESLMNAPLRQTAVKEVGQCLKEALDLKDGDDATGIFTWCLEVPDGQWTAGQAIPSIFRTLVSLGRVCLTRTTRRDEGGLSRETLIMNGG